MKNKFILFFAITLTVLQVQVLLGQENTYKPFKVAIGVAFAKTPNSDFVNTGYGLYLEPKYNINDKISVGIHLETSSFFTDNGLSFLTNGKIDIISLSSTLLTGDYYFNNEKTRPFIGVGIGMYKGRQYNINYLGTVKDLIENEVRTNFGVMPRIGVNSGHFKLSASYHVSGQNLTDYLSINVGFEIGGGKIK